VQRAEKKKAGDDEKIDRTQGLTQGGALGKLIGQGEGGVKEEKDAVRGETFAENGPRGG